MAASYSSSYNNSLQLSDGAEVDQQGHVLDVSFGPAMAACDDGMGAQVYAETVAIGADTYVVVDADIAVAGGSGYAVDASIATAAYASGTSGDVVYAATAVDLSVDGSGTAGFTISYQANTWADDGTTVEASSVTVEHVVVVTPGSDTAITQVDEPSDATAPISIDGIDGNTAAFSVDVLADGTNSFAAMELTSIAFEEFSTISLGIVVEIA